MVAHTSQLVEVPDDLSDEAAVMIEPTACAAHAALRYQGHETVIIGAGTVGLLTLAAITARAIATAAEIWIVDRSLCGAAATSYMSSSRTVGRPEQVGEVGEGLALVLRRENPGVRHRS